MMGSPQEEARRDANEGPRHKVTIDYPFEVGKFEVTFSEWNACVASGGCRGHRPNDGGWGKGNRPVINVSWKDAKSYVSWLRRTTGLNYRLLSEAEWEYVARAGQEGPFSSDSTIFTAMSMNGSKIAGIPTIQALPQTAKPAKMATANSESCAAALGSPTAIRCARRNG